MRVPFIGVGSKGVISDLPPHRLAADAWTRADNIRFKEAAAWKVYGHISYTTPSVAPYYITNVRVGTNLWVYAGLAKVYAYDGTNHTEITRASGGDYTGAATDRWNSCMLGGVLVMNNGKDVPQFFASPPSVANDLAALTAWDANWKAKVIRSYKDYLVALYVTKSGTAYPHMVKWSHPADPGSPPSSWDEADTTKDAGETSLLQSQDELVDCLTQRDTNIIYKEESVWGMQYIGGGFIFRFYKMFDTFGLLAQDCVVDIRGTHYVFGQDDIVRHDGQQASSILEKRYKRTLFNELSTANYANSFVVDYQTAKEIWFCYPTGTNTWPNKALIYNLEDDSISFRDLPSVSSAGYGIVTTGESWDSDPNPWSSDGTTWVERSFAALDAGVVMTAPGSTALWTMDKGSQFNSVSFDAVLERQSMTFEVKEGGLNSVETVKQITAVYAEVIGVAGQQIQITIGTANAIGESVTWGTPKNFTIGTDRKVDCSETGKLLSIRFSSSTAIQWKLNSFEVDVRVVGRF